MEGGLHPTQLYELGLNLGLLGCLWWYRRRAWCDGQLFLLYMGGYGVIRFVVASFRGDALQFAGEISAAQSVSVLVVMAAVTLLARWGRPTRVSLRH